MGTRAKHERLYLKRVQKSMVGTELKKIDSLPDRIERQIPEIVDGGSEIVINQDDL